MKWLVLFLVLSTAVLALELPPGVVKIVEYQNQLALSVTFLIAFLGGLLTFTSPCGFVLLPAFFAYLFKEKKRAFLMTLFFSLGLLLAFIIFGMIAGFVGSFFSIYKEFFAILAGVFLILFGVLLALNKGFSLFRFKNRTPSTSLDSFLLGFFFAVGWTPCVGPILGGIGLLAAVYGNFFKSILFFGTYGLGVVLPLLVVSYLSDKTRISSYFQSKSLRVGKVITTRYNLVGGIVFVLIGLVMFFDKGTGIFMEQIPRYVPWQMNFFNFANEYLVASDFFVSQAANIIGVLAALVTLFFIFTYFHKTYKSKR